MAILATIPKFINRVVLCLPPNTTQPLDKFWPFENRMETNMSSIQFCGKIVTRYQFSSLFGRAWMNVLLLVILLVVSVTGVYP